MVKLKKSIYTIIIFINITIFSALSVSTFQSAIKDSITNGENISDTSIVYKLSGIDKISPNQILNTIYLSDSIYIEKTDLNPGALWGKAIYFKMEPKVKPNIISGRFFKGADCISDKPLAIVGKDIFEDSQSINGEKYFEYENVKYKIIGVMGYKNRRSLCDSQFILNLNAYIKNTKSFASTSNYVVDYLNNKKENNYNFIDELKKINKTISYENISINKRKLFLNNFISEGINSSMIFIVTIFLIFINIFNVTLQWIEAKKKNIGIKKALGGNNFKISLEIIKEYQVIALISYLIGIVFYIIIVKLRLISVFNADIYLLSTLITFGFSSFVALITSIFAIIKALKIPPSVIMKGGKI